ncbi:hypothetical protein MtrunA17_Chr3g0130491 [Medicago truncatula]|uniref:Uncharacterized protein n=1 Tax=Medicago truncatula TaxID=3880 RepID=A0A396IZ87_MEDTR|nr:hypothetical protein MtrunA17_Chr3g0130491 [Medicago truncatula]
MSARLLLAWLGLTWILNQVKSGTLFDNVVITDDPEYAKQVAEETWASRRI